MFHAESKGFILRVVAGATGLSLALFLLKSHGKPDSFLGLPEALSTAKETSAVQENQRAVMVLQGRQLQILETLGSLLKSVEELKEEVKYLKDTIPKLEEQIRDELNGKNNVRKISPQHKVLKRKKETAKGAVKYPSSEESEGGYLTAHTDTEVETEDESAWAHPNAVTTKVIQETDELLSLLHQADTKRSGSVSDKQEGFHLLCDMEEKYGNKAEFLWRLARAYGDMFDLTNDAEEKKNYAGNGKSVAGKAIQLDNMNARSHQWYAIMCGYVSEFDGVQNKIKNGYLFKEHLDKAIELDPRDPLQYYLLGRWCYAVSQLSWIERKVAATIFGNPPTSTVQEALQNFLKAEEMQPGYSKYNYVFLAKCYKDLGQKINALKCCDAASAIVSATKEDRDAQKDLEVLLASLRP